MPFAPSSAWVFNIFSNTTGFQTATPVYTMGQYQAEWAWQSTSVTTAGTYAAWNDQYVETVEQQYARRRDELVDGVRLHGRRDAVEGRIAEFPELMRADVEAAVEAAVLDHEVMAAQRAEQRQLRVLAEERARALLESVLSRAQRREFREDERITVRTEKRVWRIFTEAGCSGNIALMDGRVRRATVCLHAAESGLPRHDHFLTQLLAIVHEEEEVIRRANLHGGHWLEDELAIRRDSRPTIVRAA